MLGQGSVEYVDDAGLGITQRDGNGVVWRGYSILVSDSDKKDVDMVSADT